MIKVKKYLFILTISTLMYACAPADGEYTGSEYMPDMAHSVAYEANVYTSYSLNTWDDESKVDLKTLSNPKEPVHGTVARGYAGHLFSGDSEGQRATMENLRGKGSVNGIAVPINGSVPYYYTDTEEERMRATNELIENPFPISEEGLAQGKELYNIYCGICHGEKGDGLGYIVNEEENPNVKYPAAPANFIAGDLLGASNGRYYHAIMYGKNVMGAYKDKLSYEERWQVIHWIRSLQAKELKLAYTAEENTLNDSFGTPLAMVKQMSMDMETASHGTGDHGGEHATDAEHGGDGGHGESHDGDDSHH